VESSSLPKICKTGAPGEAARIKLHYFPEIPGGFAETQPAVPGPPIFHRADLGLPAGPIGAGKGTSGHMPSPHPGNAADETSVPDEEEWERRLEIEKQEAYIRGFSEGEKVGQEGGRREVDPLLTSVGQTLMELDQLRRTLHQRAERETVKLALCIAERLLGRGAVSDPDQVVKAVGSALEHVVDSERVTIRLNPDECSTIEKIGAELVQTVDRLESFHLTPDAAIAAGGCVIETNFGEIDARIESQFERLRELLMAEVDQCADAGRQTRAEPAGEGTDNG
jgi:flagellar biosynthesis/type III secretory pathway protein FliH